MELTESHLPDPDDRALAWWFNEPAYLAWWRAVCGSAADTAWGGGTAERLIRRYGQAVPTMEALHVVLELGPLVEIGAGGGYWARLLTDLGGDIVAFDLETFEHNSWTLGSSPWHSVELGDDLAVLEHPNRAVLVVWPPRPNGFMPRLLDRAPQTTLALITDGPSHPRDPMYSRLERDWRQEQRVVLPNWPYRWDALTIWQRH